MCETITSDNWYIPYWSNFFSSIKEDIEMQGCVRIGLIVYDVIYNNDVFILLQVRNEYLDYGAYNCEMYTPTPLEDFDF